MFLFTFHACAFGAHGRSRQRSLRVLSMSFASSAFACASAHTMFLLGRLLMGEIALQWRLLIGQVTVAWARIRAHLKPCPSDPPVSASHIAGFGMDTTHRSLDEVLLDTVYEPSGRKDVFMPAVRVAAGAPPTGRSFPTILPEFLGPEDRLACALKLQHPFARIPPLPAHCARAIELHRLHGDAILTYREKLENLCDQLASALEESNEFLVSKAREWLRPILAVRKVLFMVELNYLAGYADHDLFCDLTVGLPMMGWARRSPVLIQRESSSPAPLDQHDVGLGEHNQDMIDPIRPATSPEQGSVAWEKREEDFKSGGLV